MTTEGFYLNLPLPEFLSTVGRRHLTPGGKHGDQMASKRSRSLSNAQNGPRQLICPTLPGYEDLRCAYQSPVHEDGPTCALVVIAGEELTCSSKEQRSKQLDQVRGRLADSGSLVVYEPIFRQHPCEAFLSEACKIWGWQRDHNRFALVHEWWDLLAKLGFTEIACDIGALPWFREKQVQRDEGDAALASQHVHLIGHSDAMQRYAECVRHFGRWNHYYGFCVISAAIPAGG